PLHRFHFRLCGCIAWRRPAFPPIALPSICSKRAGFAARELRVSTCASTASGKITSCMRASKTILDPVCSALATGLHVARFLTECYLRESAWARHGSVAIKNAPWRGHGFNASLLPDAVQEQPNGSRSYRGWRAGGLFWSDHPRYVAELVPVAAW